MLVIIDLVAVFVRKNMHLRVALSIQLIELQALYILNPVY